MLCVPRLISSVHEKDCLGKETDDNSLKRECAGCEGSRVIFPAIFLTLDEYSSWTMGRVVPMICSAVQTTLRSLLRSDLVAELNQTVIDVQRMESDGRVELYQQLQWQVELP